MGFLHESLRAKIAGQPFPKCTLVFGSRQEGKDDLYADELKVLQKEGVVDVHYAYSQKVARSRAWCCGLCLLCRLWCTCDRVVSCCVGWFVPIVSVVVYCVTVLFVSCCVGWFVPIVSVVVYV
jgi:hypothetical protein